VGGATLTESFLVMAANCSYPRKVGIIRKRSLVYTYADEGNLLAKDETSPWSAVYLFADRNEN